GHTRMDAGVETAPGVRGLHLGRRLDRHIGRECGNRGQPCTQQACRQRTRRQKPLSHVPTPSFLESILQMLLGFVCCATDTSTNLFLAGGSERDSRMPKLTATSSP